jgi:hypothetical protein
LSPDSFDLDVDADLGDASRLELCPVDAKGPGREGIVLNEEDVVAAKLAHSHEER